MMLSAAPGSLRMLLVWLCCFGALAFNGTVALAVDWPKIDKAELAETKPKIDPEAGAEILLRDVVLDYSSFEGAEETHYVRAKIFSERGIRHFSLVKIPFGPDQKVSGLSARTIKPDGTIVEVKSDDIHTRDERRASEGRVRSKTFAFPALEAGAVVEYKYYISSSNPKFAAPIVFQSNLPTRLVRYKVGMLRPTPNLIVIADIRFLSYNCPNQKYEAKDGFYKFEFTNLPAFKKEPFSPPDVMNSVAMMVYLSQSKDMKPAEFWRHYSKEFHKKFASFLKPTPDVTAKAGEITSGADAPEAKLQKIYDWCRTSVINRERDTTRLSAEQRKALKKNESVTDVLKNKIGTSSDINLLFVALARASGLEARGAVCNNRQTILFNEIITEPIYVFPDRVAAVQLGGEWKYFDPGSTYLPFGQLRPRNTETAVLVSDPKGQESPIIVAGEPPEKNIVRRKADLRLSSSGTLEGDVTEIYSGQEDYELKNLLDDKSPEKRGEFFRLKLVRQFKGARVTNITVDNAADPLTPTKVTYHIRIPSYAEKTGTRLFIQPAVFQKGGASGISLPEGERKTVVVFPYRCQGKDEINIELPPAYSLEAASAPPGISVGGFGEYDLQISFNRVTRILTSRREFNLTHIVFRPAAYASIKGVLAQIRERDDHTLTLKRDEGAEAPDEPAEKPESNHDSDSKTPAQEDSKSDTEFSP